MKRWYHLTASSTVLLICAIAYSFCCLYDPDGLRLSYLDVPLVVYGWVLALAACFIVGPAKLKWIGFLLGGTAFSTFVLGLLPKTTWSTHRDIEGSVAALALYGTIAAFYWIQMWRRMHIEEPEESSTKGAS